MKPAIAPSWGWLPLLTALYSTVYYAQQGQLAHTLWICNVCCYLLGIGILFRRALLVWVATLWLIAGTPLWVLERILTASFTPQAFLVHVGGSLLGLLAIRCYGASISGAWWLAVLLGLGLTLLSRWLAPAALNINMSAAVYPPLAPYFPGYWSYLAFTVGGLALVLYLLERLLQRHWLHERA